jgi:hypothetical protein
MNNKNCGTGSEHMQTLEWFAVDCLLWDNSTVKKWVVVVKTFNHINLPVGKLKKKRSVVD